MRFTGALRGEAVYAELRRADLYVQPSRRLSSGEEEGLGLSVQEAMAMGLPVVATNTGGIPESVVEGETGTLVPPDAPDALVAAIRRLASDAQMRLRMGAAGRRRVERHFNLERQSDLLRRKRFVHRMPLSGTV